MRRFLAIATLTLLAGHWPAGARGELIITIGNASIAAGGAGVVDVTITDSTATGDNLALTGLQFSITPTNGTTSTLDFSASQANSGLTASNYVFAGDSADAEGGQALGVATTPTTYTGGDNTADFANVTVTSASTFLLAQLDLTTLTGLESPKAGDTFSISLVDNPNFTFFDDNQFNSTNFTANPGTVTILAAVPEPGSATLALTGLATIGLLRLRARVRGWYRPGPRQA